MPGYLDSCHTSLVICNLHLSVLSRKYCPILTSSFKVDGVNELFINIKSVTRTCNTVSNNIECTAKLILSLYYKLGGKDIEVFALSDKIPPKMLKLNTGFIHSSDDISFSINQNYNHLKLRFQSHFYCHNIRSISVYYYLCPVKTNVLVDFLEAPAASKTSSPYIFLLVLALKTL